jgi:hypothetical protein
MEITSSCSLLLVRFFSTSSTYLCFLSQSLRFVFDRLRSPCVTRLRCPLSNFALDTIVALTLRHGCLLECAQQNLADEPAVVACMSTTTSLHKTSVQIRGQGTTNTVVGHENRGTLWSISTGLHLFSSRPEQWRYSYRQTCSM